MFDSTSPSLTASVVSTTRATYQVHFEVMFGKGHHKGKCLLQNEDTSKLLQNRSLQARISARSSPTIAEPRSSSSYGSKAVCSGHLRPRGVFLRQQ